MKFLSLSTLVPIVTLGFSHLVSASVDFSKYDYIIKEIEDLSKKDELYKRGEAEIEQFTSLFQSVGNSNIIPEILTDITSSQDKMDNLANLTYGLIGAVSSGASSFEGININLNYTELLNAVLSSGIIQSTAGGLLLNNANNAKLADFVGGILGSPNNVWIGWLLMGLGNGEDLTVPYLANLIVNSTSKANTNPDNQTQLKNVKVQPQEDQVVIKDPVNDEEEDNAYAGSLNDFVDHLINKRDDDNSTDQYAGSLNQFINNVAGAITQSTLVQSSANDILVALNRSDIVVPLVMELLDNPNLGTLVQTIVKKLYNEGVLNDIPLDPYYEFAKKQGYLSDGLQYLLTDPTYAPALATLLKRMDDAGVYQRLQDNMYGIKK
ncbi:hypothetical protein SBY92_005018 [Candida maltosa Xu316]|uniref:Uncharacterized protein n=1 Tax=Candida maltosa (strain Xu316) TaxID=1245528 RepID=M3JXY9_CANMX|nr:hypothetical protein G210_1704 [Candida maltosa Xu316]